MKKGSDMTVNNLAVPLKILNPHLNQNNMQDKLGKMINELD